MVSNLSGPVQAGMALWRCSWLYQCASSVTQRLAASRFSNAMAESFFTSLECELINRRSWQTKSQARLAVFTWIESWYNPMRRHSGINYKAPNNFEKALNDEEIESNQQTPKGFTQEAQTVR
jgi:hypothetical protein